MSDSMDTAGGSTDPQLPADGGDGQCLYDALIGALDDLDEDPFKRFKLFLMDGRLLGNFEVIKKEKLDTDDRTEVLKAMMDSYGNYTINVIKRVLEELCQYRILQELRNYPYDPEDDIAACKKKLQSNLIAKFQFLVESLSKKGQKISFNEGYTELFITEADSGQVNEEHEVRQMEILSKTSSQDRTLRCQHIFTTNTGKPARVVLTKGVAGVGKTVQTQKFSLDWAEREANQDIQLLFHFTFRELNILRNTEYSLVELLHHCFKESTSISCFQYVQVLFIFDGLDEWRFPLDFSRTQVLTEPTKSVPVEVLLVNLIRGSLLPSARVWITTRPAAASQIPAESISMVTEVRGFTDLQKEQYFRKRFLEKELADKIISHVKSIRSLYIMSFIPIFCWIISTVLQHILEEAEEPELPNTLTEMYVHFLVVQAKIKNIKYHGASGADLHWTEETKEMLKSLGKLAFEQLLNGRLIFYVSDLSDCGLDAVEIARYSGVFTEVFREERGLYEDKVYCFIHLSVQEFLAALHVHQTFFSSKENLLSESPAPEDSLQSTPSSTVTPEAFYRSAVDRALESSNGHLDLFLRFLLGLSLPSNQWLLPGLLNPTRRTDQKTIKYIKEKLNKEKVSPERSLNLFHCLNELNDRSLLEQIEKYMKRGQLSDENMSSADWSALSFLLLSSDLKEFDLRKYCPSEKGVLNLLPVIKASTKAILSVCGVTSRSCGRLASVLSFSSLKHLDLRKNDLQDSGVKRLCEGLKSNHRLETLRLTTCNLSPNVCAPLASVLSSSSLTHLDLSDNNLGDSGVEQLCEGLKSDTCSLKILKLSGCLISESGGAFLVTALCTASSHLRELDLSYNHPGESAEFLTAMCADPKVPLQTVNLDPAGKRFMVPGPRKYSCGITLDRTTAHTRLKLSDDDITVSETASFMPFQFQDPGNGDKFTESLQVLGSSELKGRCYWEVEWKGQEFEIAVSYRGISREGDQSRFGNNNQSWSMRIQNEQYSFVHNKKKFDPLSSCSRVTSTLSGLVPFAQPSGRVGVYLDSEAGALSFYDIGSDGKLILYHTFCCCFSQPVFPGFGVLWPGSSLSLNVKSN